jgi:hypothetical protein
MSWIPGYEYTDGAKAAPARERFTTPDAIYRLFEEYRRYDIKDQERRAKIQAIYNKNRPYNPDDLAKVGQKFRTNINFGALANAIDARAGAVARIANETCNIISLESPVPQFSGPEEEQVLNVIEEEFSRAIRRDGRPIASLAVMNKEADLYGCGPMTWRSPEDYVPQALRRGQVLFDPEGSVNSSDHEVIMIDTELEAAEVFRMLDNPEYAERLGWNIEALKRWTIRVFHDDQDSRSNTSAIGGTGIMESMIETMRRNDFYEANQFRKFHVLFVYVQEMAAPRGITHIIVPATNQGDTEDPEKEILFKKKNAYKSMDEVFFWFCPDITKHYIRSARGIASDVAPKSAAKDRLSCAMVDGVIRSLTLVVKQSNPGASPIMSLQEIGPYTVVGQDFDPIPNANQMSNFQSALQVANMLDQESVGSLAGTAFGNTMPKLGLGGNGQTKSESEILEHKRLQRDENYMMSRLATHRLAWEGTFKRFMNIATGPDIICREYPYVQEFKERCEKHGVTKDSMKQAIKDCQVDVSREVAIGMDGLTQMITMAIGQFGGNTDEAGRRRMSHDIVRYQLGSKLANRYFPIQSRDNGPSNDASIAQLENNAVKNGQPVQMGPDQRQDVHIRVHMQVLSEIQEAVQNGLAEAQREWQQQGQMQQDANGQLAPKIEDPEKLMQVLDAMMKHIRSHLEIYQNEKGVAPKVKGIEQTLTGMGDVKQALNLAIATQRRVREAEEKKKRLEMEALQKQADEAEIAKATHQMDIEGQNARRKIELDHALALERLRMENETGRARLQMENENGRARLQMEGESMRGRQMLEAEAARHNAALRSAEAESEDRRRNFETERNTERKNFESQNAMRLSERSAALDARLRAGAAAAESLENQRRAREVTGREVPQPDEFNPQSAVSGILPL